MYENEEVFADTDAISKEGESSYKILNEILMRNKRYLRDEGKNIIIFDLETTDLNVENCGVIGIVCKSQFGVFDEYIDPEKSISPKSRNYHRLTIRNNRFYSKEGKEVKSSPLPEVLNRLYKYLKNFGEPCVLTAHGCHKFQAPILMRIIKEYRMENRFSNVIDGFIDTLTLFKQKLPRRKSYALRNLSYNLFGDGPTSAITNVFSLQELMCDYDITYKDAIKYVKSFDKFLRSTKDVEKKIVYFAMDTTGLNSNDCGVLRIACVSGFERFDEYVNPEKCISPGAQQYHGLTARDDSLYFYDQEVESSPLPEVLDGLYEYLKIFGKPCILAAHNCHLFQAPILMRIIKECRMEKKFSTVIDGFIDTLILLKPKLPGRQNYQLLTLAQEVIPRAQNQQRSAINNAKYLQKLTRFHTITYKELTKCMKSFDHFIGDAGFQINVRKRKSSLGHNQPKVSKLKSRYSHYSSPSDFNFFSFDD